MIFLFVPRGSLTTAAVPGKTSPRNPGGCVAFFSCNEPRQHDQIPLFNVHRRRSPQIDQLAMIMNLKKKSFCFTPVSGWSGVLKICGSTEILTRLNIRSDFPYWMKHLMWTVPDPSTITWSTKKKFSLFWQNIFFFLHFQRSFFHLAQNGFMIKGDDTNCF